MEQLKPGLYEQVLTEKILYAVASLSGRAKLDKIDKAEAPALLAQFLNAAIISALESADGDDHAEQRLVIVNNILKTLKECAPETDLSPIRDLEQSLIGILSPGQNQLPPAPRTPLNFSSLFTGSKNEPALGNELLAEMRSADQVDILVSFIKNSGLRVLRSGFDDLMNRGVQVRIITTVYMGATDAEAIEALASYPNVSIKVSYDTKATRLHAKAYYFRRNSGFSTAYVGSSNMSNPAITEGLEWNLKATRQDLPQIIKAFESEFDGYWNNQDFQPYQRGTDLLKLRETLSSSRNESSPSQPLALIDIFPRPFQERILEELQAERKVRGYHRNLIVAATGTGKTIISAFDYKRFCETHSTKRPRLLFLAHRDEILGQSLSKFRHVLKDADFGEQMGGSAGEPRSMDHLFCTVQTAQSRRIWERLGREYYDFIVVDEAHHAAADTYKDILMGFSPKILLGMTATPERMDGDSILPFFDNRIASELRLPEALEEKLLCPFQYFCVSDPVSLADDSFWENGKYRTAALEKAYVDDTGTAELRVNTILGAIARYTLNEVGGVKGLGFCASVRHAEYMAEQFTAKGLPSLALSAQTDDVTRKAAVRRLSSGELKFIFTVDLFNEGVDIPEVNLVLFLRPTDSLTIYLQQLGRGLRHSKGKECLVVLDFVAQMHKRYRIDRKFAALLPGKRFNMPSEVEAGFPHVPAGCTIQLEKQAMDVVLANIKAAYSNIRNYVAETLKTFEQDSGLPLTFANYVKTHDIDPAKILDIKPWYQWRMEARGEPVVEEPHSDLLKQAAERIAQASGPEYLRQIRGLPDAGSRLVTADKAGATMLHSLLWQRPGSRLGMKALSESFELLRSNPEGLADLSQVADYRLDVTTCKGTKPYAGLPLELHAHYGNDEIQAAFGRDLFTEGAQRGVGVLHFPWCKSYALLVTLQKSEKDFSPTTMYRDYPISQTLFHWESQSNTSRSSESGLNLINHEARGYQIFLFVRAQKKNGSKTLPFQFLGRVNHTWHEGDRPIAFKWQLEHPMPAVLLEQAR